MSEQIKKWLSTLIIVALVAGVAWGRWLGHAERDQWYAAHPVVKEGEVIHDWEVCTYTCTGQKCDITKCDPLPSPTPPVPIANSTATHPEVREPKPNVIYCGDRPCSDFKAKPSKRSKPIYDELWSTVPPLSKELRLSKEQAANPPLPTFTKEWVGHCLAGYNVYTCDGDGCKNTVPSPELSDRRKYECYGWNGVIIGVN